MATAAKTAIVTGASQGIGAGIAKAFLDRGYRVVANSRHIAQAVLYLTEAQTVTGEVLHVDGGAHRGKW
jgi:NAD(P)-dependent dehydrogenase (short-subunit alcohol dehydrogenase family)